MKQATALAILDAGHSVFLTGAAGSGKTYVLNKFIREARSDGKSVAVTASTGIAATHLGGTTIHSWAGIGIADEIRPKMVGDMPKTRQDKIVSADILVIDEVSMLHDFRLDMVEEVCRLVRQNNKPFGGLQVVMSGDFFQLPPVNRADSKQGGFVVNADSWQTLEPVVCYLDEQHRQEDDQLLDILSALRAGDLRRRHASSLLARRQARTPFDTPSTELYTKNIDVDSVNQRYLESIDDEAQDYVMTSTGRASAVESLKKSCLAPELLQLKVGAFVMFVKNSPEGRYVNGTLGTVVGFNPDNERPIIETTNGRRIEAAPATWEMRDGEKLVASLTQIPLRLAWAITVHKSQGMTLDSAHIDLGDAFVPGMGYVALSRVRSLDKLTLGGINRTALQINPEALEIDAVLRKQSALNEKSHSQTEESYVAKMANKKAKPEKEKSGTWTEKIEKMREKYPNAYKRWTELEDKQLLDRWEGGKTVKQLSESMGRHQGSIRARLKKHLGEDLFEK